MKDSLKFQIGQEVYHRSPDSDRGIIIDINYSYRTKLYKYLVSLSVDKSEWCDELELSESKVF